MLYINKNSPRKNAFRDVYDNENFKKVLVNRKTPAAFPFLVDIELTNVCNNQCIFCGQQTMTREKGFMSEEIFKKAVDECAEHNTSIRFIRWGEPFLHPKIIDYCRYIKEKGLMLHITNNGLAIKTEDMQALIDLEVDSIIFSFQGATKQEYEKMRNNKLYDLLVERISEFVKIRGERAKPFLHISTTVTSESPSEIESFVERWLKIADSAGVGRTNLSKLSVDQIKSMEVLGKLELLKKQETIAKKYVPCTEVYQKLSVDWDGKVACCCGDYDNYLTVGDIKHDTLYNVWHNSEELKAIRTLLDKGRHKCLTLCSRCYHFYDEF